MKRISILVSILCACIVSLAWGEQPAGTCNNNWTEFHRTNMMRWNPCEKVLNINNCWEPPTEMAVQTRLRFNVVVANVANGWFISVR